MALLEEQIALAETEDEWDRLLTRMHGIQEDDGKLDIQEDDGKLGRGWAKVPRYGLQDIQQKIKADDEKTNELAVKMFEIVEKEQTLVEEEELERGRQKQDGIKPVRSQKS